MLSGPVTLIVAAVILSILALYGAHGRPHCQCLCVPFAIKDGRSHSECIL
jgi:hypothetical protein